MTLTPDELKRIQEEELERYKARRRLEAFDSLQGEERELADSFSAEQKERYADADSSARRNMMRKAMIANIPKIERATFDKLKQPEQENILALPKPERYQKLTQLKPKSRSSGCLTFAFIAAFAGYAYKNSPEVGGLGSSGQASERSENVDPLEVAREVERRLDIEYRRAAEEAATTGNPSDVRRTNMLMKAWQDAAQRVHQIELRQSTGR